MNKETKKEKTKPQTLKGFRDFLPEDMKLREYVIEKFKQVFEKYGYEPLETPALEYADTLLGVSGEEAEKEFYRFKDQGGREVVMRFEVMVPMCRVIAQYKEKLVFPFKRYQIQRCWRAEKPQKGRLREFTQCDADTIGTSSMTADGEFIQMGIEALKDLGFKNFKAQISNRKFLAGLFKFFKIDADKFCETCSSIDKLRKIGLEKVKKELVEKRGISSSQADGILEIISTKEESEKLFEIFRQKIPGIPEIEEAINEIKEIFKYLKDAEVDPSFYCFDPTIARGLAHYTGPVWEFEVLEGNVGSVGGCGRYDNVICSYLGTDRQIPATGGSFGIERIMTILKEQKMVKLPSTYLTVLVTIFDENSQPASIKIANKLRGAPINTMLYPDYDAKLEKQLKYADRKGIPYCLIIGPDEIKEGKVTIKNMQKKTQEKIKEADLIKYLKSHQDSA